MWRRTGYLHRKKESKNEICLLGRCWEWLLSLACLYNVGLKVDMARQISTAVMMSYYENIPSCKRHTVVRRMFCFWRFALPFLGLVTHYCESWLFLIVCLTYSMCWHIVTNAYFRLLRSIGDHLFLKTQTITSVASSRYVGMLMPWRDPSLRALHQSSTKFVYDLTIVSVYSLYIVAIALG